MPTRDARPDAPVVWSFSALRDARECPRRWSLRRHDHAPRAAVPGASDASPGIGSLRGRICHAALERMIEAHRTRGGPSWGDPRLQGFWRAQFPAGLTALVREEAHRALEAGSNGADPARSSRVRREIDEALPSLTSAVTTLLRMTLSRAAGSATVHAEVPVAAEVAPGLRWKGRIDAVIRHGDSATLVDFKTGAPSPTDMEQLTVYACLFEGDAVTHAWEPVRRLAVLYTRGGVEERDAPSGVALEAERRRIAAETVAVARRLEASPLEAAPADDRCPRCEVRGRCDAYWRARAHWAHPLDGALLDAEGVVDAVLAEGRALRLRVGADALIARVAPALERTALGLPIGSRVRIVGARVAQDREDDSTDRYVLVDPGGLIVLEA